MFVCRYEWGGGFLNVGKYVNNKLTYKFYMTKVKIIIEYQIIPCLVHKKIWVIYHSVNCQYYIL